MLEEMNFSPEEFAQTDWRTVISHANTRNCSHYSPLFGKEYVQAEAEGNAIRSNIFLLLDAVCFMRLVPCERSPFTTDLPLFGRRSTDAIDFSESHIRLLKMIFSQVDDPELKARIGDVIWTCQRRDNIKYAEAAVDAYLEAGENLLKTDEFSYGVDRFIRAMHLANSLGRNSTKLSFARNRIDSLIDKSAQLNSEFLGQLLDLLYDFRHQEMDSNKYAMIAETLARHYQDTGIWYIARSHWKTAAQWFQFNRNIELAKACRISEAECYVQEADVEIKKSEGNRYSVATHHLQSAIELLRNIPGTHNRQKELHLLMLELQEKTSNELAHFSKEIDLSLHIEKAILAVKDKPFPDALFTLCLLTKPPSKASLRDMTEKSISDHGLMSWIPMAILNGRGRTVGRRESMLVGAPDAIEAAKIAEMHKRAQIEQEAIAFVINAARLEIYLEHESDIRVFLELIYNNPFIPPGRELIFARGLMAGYQGDFLEALHLLVPQVENSIRYMLERKNVITSTIDPDGIQKELNLNELLFMSEVKEIFGEDLVFDLQGTLISPFGANFRNLIAHGLVNQGNFYSYSAIYIWWQLLRICCVPMLIHQLQEETRDSDKKTE